MKDKRTTTLVIEQGRTLRQVFRITNRQTGAVIDPAAEGYTRAVLQVRDKHLSEGGTLLLELSTDNGGVVLGAYDDGTGTMWSGYLYAGGDATGALTPFGEGVYDFVAIHTNGNVDTVRRGVAVLIPAVTEVS